MSADLHIEKCRHDQVAAVQRFIDEHWRAGHILSRDAELLLWQHSAERGRAFGFDGPSILLAMNRDEIVGMLGLIPARFNVRGRGVSGVWMALLNVIPEARSTLAGLKLLGALRPMGFEAIGVLGINAEVAKLYAGLHYEILGDLPRWVGVFDAERAIGLLPVDGPREAVRELIAACQVNGMNAMPSGSHVEAQSRTTERFGAEWDSLWREQIAPTLIGTARDSAYLNWRYVDHPRFAYARLIARNPDGSPAGLAVVRIESTGSPPQRVLRIVEFLSAPRAAAAMAALSGAVIAIGREQGAAFADFYCASPKFAAAIEAVGFKRQTPRADGLVLPCRLQPLEHGAFAMRGAFFTPPAIGDLSGRLLEADDLYVTKSDGDMDRPN